MDRKGILLSIHPEFAFKILEGSKTLELRKVRPRVTSEDIVILYASSPLCAIVGAFEVASVVEDAPEEIWDSFKAQVGIDKRRYSQYFSCSEMAVGIGVGKVWSCLPRIPLDLLRELWPGFHPPQGFRYIRLHRGAKPRRALSPIQMTLGAERNWLVRSSVQ